VQRVVEGAQVGVHFFGEIPGQKPQRLARLHRRPGQDDPAHLALAEGRDRHGHGEVGFSGAGRPDAENDVVVADRFDVFLLRRALGGDRTLFGGDVHRVQEDVLQLDAVIPAQHPRGIVDVVRMDGVAFLQ